MPRPSQNPPLAGTRRSFPLSYSTLKHTLGHLRFATATWLEHGSVHPAQATPSCPASCVLHSTSLCFTAQLCVLQHICVLQRRHGGCTDSARLAAAEHSSRDAASLLFSEII